MGHRVNWVSGSHGSWVTGSMGHKMWPSSMSETYTTILGSVLSRTFSNTARTLCTLSPKALLQCHKNKCNYFVQNFSRNRSRGSFYSIVREFVTFGLNNRQNSVNVLKFVNICKKSFGHFVVMGPFDQGWQVFARRWKKPVFFHGKNRTGKNSFCQQK